jgi:metal-responsive CopG/Arc/MetJ family transcriptional regulator
MAEEFTQVNVNVTKEDAHNLDQMAVTAGYDNRSAFVRWLIRQEYARRYSQQNPVITIEEAQTAAEQSQLS